MAAAGASADSLASVCCTADVCASPRPDEVAEFVRLTDAHRRLVVKIGAAVYPQLDLSSHDLSKYGEPELGAYALKFVRRSADADNPRWPAALEHHYEHNAHHPQHWGGRDMPEPFLLESLVDMVAAYVQYQLGAEDFDAVDYAWFAALDEKYLARYSARDRGLVRAELRRLAALGGCRPPQPPHFLHVGASDDGGAVLAASRPEASSVPQRSSAL